MDDDDIVVCPGPDEYQRRLHTASVRAAAMGLELGLRPRTNLYLIGVVVGARWVVIAEPRDLTQALIVLAWLKGKAGKALIRASRAAVEAAEVVS